MTTEEKALALVERVRQICTSSTVTDVCFRELADELERAIEREQAAIEAHEADKKAFSDACNKVWDLDTFGREQVRKFLSPFILPEPEPDPLVEARRQIADRVLRQYGAPASDEDCIGLIVAALEEQAKSERIEQ